MRLGSRYELKYVIDEARAAAIREVVRGYLRPSIYNRAGPVPGAPVISLYFDSPDLICYRQSLGGLKNRLKLRVRFYDDQHDHPAYLEVKRRVGEAIIKQRAMVSREAVRQMLAGARPGATYWPDRAHLLNGRQQGDAQRFFCHLCSTLGARGILYVCYLREAWESPGEGWVRVTFDRHIQGAWYDGAEELAIPARGTRPELHGFPRDGVVLELKFTHGAPRWLSQLVQAFDLQRRSVSKYCACIETMGLQRGLRAPVRPPEEILR